jgi:hypothetical protein
MNYILFISLGHVSLIHKPPGCCSRMMTEDTTTLDTTTLDTTTLDTTTLDTTTLDTTTLDTTTLEYKTQQKFAWNTKAFVTFVTS